MELIKNPHLQELLVGHSDLHGVVGGAMLLVPLADQGHILGTSHVAAAKVEWPWGPVKRDAVGRGVCEKGSVIEQGLDNLGELEGLDALEVGVLRSVGDGTVGRQGIHDRIVVEGWQIGIVGLDVSHSLVVVRTQDDLARARVVEEGEGDAVLCSELLTNDDLVDVVELVPILILVVHVAVQRLELGASRNGHVQSLRSVERLLLEEVEVILVHQIGQQLVGETVQHTLLGQSQAPLPVACAVDLLGVEEGNGIVEPLDDGLIFIRVQLHLDGLERLDIQDVITIIERRLLIIERREAHSLEVSSVSLLSSHHDPHGTPLGEEDWLDDLLALSAEGDGSTAVVDRAAVPDLLPWDGDVLQQFVHRVWQVLQSSQIDTFVVAELSSRHVAVVLNDLSDVFGRHFFLLLLDYSKFSLLAVPLGIQRLPLSGLFIQQLFLRLLVVLRCLHGRATHATGTHRETLCWTGMHLWLMLLGSRHARREHEGVHSQAVLALLALEVIHSVVSLSVYQKSSTNLGDLAELGPRTAEAED
mmetsp:Transcript_39335/g.83814  ORF Transcript_39335/g.83814 Transcript_39335/m.83814 type:complete len:530 (-) Transcript_39335:36-1625(-)